MSFVPCYSLRVLYAALVVPVGPAMLALSAGSWSLLCLALAFNCGGVVLLVPFYPFFAPLSASISCDPRGSLGLGPLRITLSEGFPGSYLAYPEALALGRSLLPGFVAIACCSQSCFSNLSRDSRFVAERNIRSCDPPSPNLRLISHYLMLIWRGCSTAFWAFIAALSCGVRPLLAVLAVESPGYRASDGFLHTRCPRRVYSVCSPGVFICS